MASAEEVNLAMHVAQSEEMRCEPRNAMARCPVVPSHDTNGFNELMSLYKWIYTNGIINMI